MKLNIGCGNKIWPGFVNIDFPGNYSGLKPDIECDIRHIPISDNSATEAHAIHVLEHFYRWEAESVLAEWIRVLEPGGMLVIEVPCLDKIIRLAEMMMNNKQPVNAQLVHWGLFGDPRYKVPEMTHHWCYMRGELEQLMRDAGLEMVKSSLPRHHVEIRDIRVTGVKPKAS